MPAAPIVVSSPTARSGTSLIQRLISSSENGICYGANAARRLLMLTEFTHTECVALQERSELQSRYLQNLLSGDMNFGSVDLEILGELPKHALVGALTFFKQHCDEATKAIEKEIWACRSPKGSFLTIAKAADFISDLKCIYVYRNVVDTMRSQKSMGLIRNEDDLASACMEWVRNTDVIAALNHNNFEQIPAMLLPIKLETFLAQKNESIRHLEDFTGLENIQRAIADSKVNVSEPVSEADQTPVLSYQKPAPLTDVELHLIAHLCRDKMAEIYPENSDLLETGMMVQ
ncbi:MAG: hypothetical protein ABJL55_20515 [Roseibium sp.]